MHVTIIGTGLIGCSLGMALRRAGHHVTGVDHNSLHLEQAHSRGGIDDALPMEEALKLTQLVVLCVPVDTIAGMLPGLLDQLSPHTVVMDLGSTKADICNAVEDHSNRKAFVAVHPMAGVEHSGPLAAHIDLFLHARVIICNAHQSSTDALNRVLSVLQELKMKVIFMDADHHDRQLALVSHLPQFIAYALSSMDEFANPDFKEWTELGGGGLQSSIRLGKSDANMWIPVFQQNKENLLQIIDRYMQQLSTMKDMVLNNDKPGMQQLILNANTNYEKLNYSNNIPRASIPEKNTPQVFYS